MGKQTNFVRARREIAGLTQQELADLAGYSKGAISMIERGERDLSAESSLRISQALGVAADSLLRHPETDQDAGVPILGSVAANGETYHIWDYDLSVITDRLPMVVKGAEMALPIKGDSMFPRFKDGEFAIVGAIASDPSFLVGRDVVARISDGRIVIKELARCPTGRWTLESVNPMHRRIEDVDLEWIRPVISNLIAQN